MIKVNKEPMEAAHILKAQSGARFICFKRGDDRYLLKIEQEEKE